MSQLRILFSSIFQFVLSSKSKSAPAQNFQLPRKQSIMQNKILSLRASFYN